MNQEEEEEEEGLSRTECYYIILYTQKTGILFAHSGPKMYLVLLFLLIN